MAASDVPDIQIKSVGKTVCPRCGMMVDVSGVSAFAPARCGACDTSFAAPGQLGQYVLLKPISHSATAVSLKGFDTSMSRHVEVKVMLKELCDEVGRVRQFQAEARALASLDNRCVARAFFVGEEGGRPYAVTELIEGKALSKFISPDKPLSEIRTLTLALDVGSVLRDLEAKGLCHGRITPDNIVLTSKTTLKVVNFGAESDTASAAPAAAPHYLAPEQIQGQQGDFRSDIYALGATMFCALTGRPPFEGETAPAIREAHLTSTPPDIRSVRQSVCAQTAGVVARMLQRDPDDRYDNVDALLADLRSALSAAETAKLARKGDAAAALSTMTGQASSSEASAASSSRARPDTPGRAKASPRVRPRSRVKAKSKVKPKAKTKRTARVSSSASRTAAEAAGTRKRNMIIGAAALCVVIIVTAIIVLGPGSSSLPVNTAGGESFTGNGGEKSASGQGMVVVEGFDLPGWSINGEAEFDDGALALVSNKDGGARVLSRKLAPGAFAFEIDMKSIAPGASKNYEVHIVESSDLVATFGIRGGRIVVGVEIPGKGWKPIVLPKHVSTESVSWKVALSAGKDGGGVWTASWQAGSDGGELVLGGANSRHFALYANALKLDAPRTLRITSSGRSARVSLDHYTQTGGGK